MARPSLFREQSMSSISSPEQLDQYIRVPSPRAWIALVVLVLLLVAGAACLALASVPVTEPVTVSVEDGALTGTADLPDGTYEAQIAVDERHLLELLLGL